MQTPLLPGFTYLQPLGSGGFADVLLYEQEWPRQRVAVKVVRPGITFTEREKSLFRSEADAMARLADHPYIVSVLNAGETADGRPYLVMRYCPPPDLGARVRTQPMSVPDAISTGIKLASAVETAHRSGILHRDIKPSNVLVTTYSEPALTDFGIAGRVHEVNADSEVRMSYPWAPPELVDGRSNGSVASDVYSLGATIWNLLVGRSPYSVPHGDNSDRALALRILHSPAPTTQRPDVPAALDRLLQQCLAKDPAHRPGSALELAQSLQRIESALGFARTPIAVEDTGSGIGSGIGSSGVRDESDEDATRLKPMASVSASPPPPTASPSVVAAGGSPTPDGSPGAADAEPGRGATLWALAGVAVAIALLAFLLLRGGGDPAPDAAAPRSPRSSTSPTPQDVLQGATVPAPNVTGRRVDGGAAFSWEPSDDGRPGDEYRWTVTSTGASSRTVERSVRVRGRLPLCLQVELIRGSDGSQPSKPVCVRK